MPFARIEIEQLERDRFHIEFEGAGISADRRTHNARSMHDALDWIRSEFNRRAPVPKPPKLQTVPVEHAGPLPAPVGKQAAHEARQRDDEATKRRTELFAEARELGIDVDMRWGEQRLRQVIADHRGMAALEDSDA